MDLTTATPEQCDREMYRLIRVLGRQNSEIAAAVERAHHVVGDTLRWVGRRQVWNMRTGAVIDALVAADRTSDRAATALAAIRLAQEAAAETHGDITAINLEWHRRGRWSRTYMVTNSNGHGHRTNGWDSPRCSSCYPTTEYGILFQLSGATDAEVVAALGEDACTVCYKGAPTTPRTVFTPDEEAEREAKAADLAAKQAKADAKAAQAITDLDGSPLLDDDRRALPTERAAKNKALDIAGSMRWYPQHPDTQRWTEALARIIPALAAKAGRTVEDVEAEINRKADAKHRRETA